MKKINLNLNLSLGIGKLNEILSHYDSVEDYLYDLIDAEHELKNRIAGEVNGSKEVKPFVNHPAREAVQ
jgi:hypothetical protein